MLTPSESDEAAFQMSSPLEDLLNLDKIKAPAFDRMFGPFNDEDSRLSEQKLMLQLNEVFSWFGVPGFWHYDQQSGVFKYQLARRSSEKMGNFNSFRDRYRSDNLQIIPANLIPSIVGGKRLTEAILYTRDAFQKLIDDASSSNVDRKNPQIGFSVEVDYDAEGYSWNNSIAVYVFIPRELHTAVRTFVDKALVLRDEKRDEINTQLPHLQQDGSNHYTSDTILTVINNQLNAATKRNANSFALEGKATHQVEQVIFKYPSFLFGGRSAINLHCGSENAANQVAALLTRSNLSFERLPSAQGLIQGFNPEREIVLQVAHSAKELLRGVMKI